MSPFVETRSGNRRTSEKLIVATTAKTEKKFLHLWFAINSDAQHIELGFATITNRHLTPELTGEQSM